MGVYYIRAKIYRKKEQLQTNVKYIHNFNNIRAYLKLIIPLQSSSFIISFHNKNYAAAWIGQCDITSQSQLANQVSLWYVFSLIFNWNKKNKFENFVVLVRLCLSTKNYSLQNINLVVRITIIHLMQSRYLSLYVMVSRHIVCTVLAHLCCTCLNWSNVISSYSCILLYWYRKIPVWDRPHCHEIRPKIMLRAWVS